MKEYHKIDCPLKRDDKTHKLIPGEWRRPEYEYLANSEWHFTEKVDGTNIRVLYDGGDHVEFRGRTDKSQIPKHLLEKLQELFPLEKMKTLSGPICLYGEGYGVKIQSGGKYISGGVDFTLFDVRVDDWWLENENTLGIANQLDIKPVPTWGKGTLIHAITEVTKGRLQSHYGDFIPEGLVARPAVQLFNRKGERIILKIKAKDFQSNAN